MLGHRAEELARLDGQGKMLEPATRLALQLAGIGPGMRVLDLGTGTGEVALLVAEVVGPDGSVLAVDRAADGLAYAAAKFADRGVTNIELVEADVASYEPDEPVDAVLGRLVLSYLPDPVATIRRLLGSIRPGGVYLALEYDAEAVRSAPQTPVVERLAALMNAAFAAVGTPQTLGPHLAVMLREAGATDAQSLGLQAYLAPDDPTGPAMLSAVIGSLVPAITGHGLADPAELDIAEAARADRGRGTGCGGRDDRADPGRRLGPPGLTSAHHGWPPAGAVHDDVGALADAVAGEQLPLVEHELPPVLPVLDAVALEAAGQPEVVLDLDPHQHGDVRRERGSAAADALDHQPRRGRDLDGPVIAAGKPVVVLVAAGPALGQGREEVGELTAHSVQTAPARHQVVAVDQLRAGPARRAPRPAWSCRTRPARRRQTSRPAPSVAGRAEARSGRARRRQKASPWPR